MKEGILSMGQKKGEIRIVVQMPKSQENTNEIYCELIRSVLKNVKIETAAKKRMLDELLRKWK